MVRKGRGRAGWSRRRGRDIKALLVLLFHVSHLDGVIVSFLPVGHGGWLFEIGLGGKQARKRRGGGGSTQMTKQAARGEDERNQIRQ